VKYYTVVIPTTKNVVGISDIIIEDPLVSSVICENNSLEALPISGQYNSFVKSPTGVIEKITGNSSYRIDITSKIQQGNSWQLAIAIAHILHNNKLLSFSNEENLISNNNVSVIWASGTINANLDVKGINYLDNKVKKSITFFRQCVQKNIIVKIIISHENKDYFHKILDSDQFLKDAILKKQIIFISVKNLKNFFEKNLKLSIHNIQNNSLNFFSKIRKYLKPIIFSFCFLFVILQAYNIWQVITPLAKLKAEENHRILLTNLSEYRQGKLSQRIGAYFFDYFQQVEANKLNNQVTLNFLPYSKESNLRKICMKKEMSFYIDCGLNVEATNVGNEKVFLWMLRYTDDQFLSDKKFKSVIVNPELINGMIQSKETISIDIKERKKPSVLFFVYGNKFDNKIRKWLLNLSKRKSLLNSTVKRIKTLGYGFSVKKINHVSIIKDVY
tara:strand:- start:152 stop:1483 length:1332 start_codon:yes stop_codon:yes gene_type:complete